MVLSLMSIPHLISENTDCEYETFQYGDFPVSFCHFNICNCVDTDRWFDSNMALLKNIIQSKKKRMFWVTSSFLHKIQSFKIIFPHLLNWTHFKRIVIFLQSSLNRALILFCWPTFRIDSWGFSTTDCRTYKFSSSSLLTVFGFPVWNLFLIEPVCWKSSYSLLITTNFERTMIRKCVIK